MSVSDREIDRAMKYGLDDFDWLWAVVEMARGRPWNEQTPAQERRDDSREEAR